jgi:uncharacterized protein (DUF1015 family)
VDGVRRAAPLYGITTPDGIAHTVWRISSAAMIAKLIELFRGVEALYIADGHHRTASAVRYGQACRARNPHPTGSEPYEFFMAAVFPHNQLKILAYNRVVKDLNGLTPDQFLARIGEKFEVSSARSRQPSQAASFGMYLQGKWYTLRARAGSYPAGDPIKRLDVSILQDNLLSPLLGIDDPRTDNRIDCIGGIRGMDELERRVNAGAIDCRRRCRSGNAAQVHVVRTKAAVGAAGAPLRVAPARCVAECPTNKSRPRCRRCFLAVV